MNSDARLLLEGLLQTLWMVLPSALLAQLLGLALGLVLVRWHPQGIAPRPFAYRALGAVVNTGRSLPFVILLVLVIPLSRLITGTSIGATAAIVPLTVASIPFMARLVESALLEVPRGVVEAARSFGATRQQILLRILLPEALPALVRGFTVAVVSLIGFSAMAGAIGGGGLGDLAIRYGYQRFEPRILAATVVLLIGLVQLAQGFGERVASELDHRTSQAPGGRRALAIMAAVAAVVVLGLCVLSQKSESESHRLGLLRIGASPTPHAEILEFARPLLEKRGVKLEVRVFDDYVQPNLALGDGSIDVNFFQTVPYLTEFQKSRPLGLVPHTKVHVEPMAVYSARVKSLDALKAGDVVAIPNEPSNSGRALLLLQKAGLVKLDPKATIRATPRDVTDNPRGLVFRELDAAQLPRVLPDVAAAVLNANYAFEAKLSPAKDGLFVEDTDSPYANVLTIKPGLRGARELAVLDEVLTSDAVRGFIEQRYGGSVVPAFGREAKRARTTLRVGASPTPQAEILEVAKPLLAAQGIDLEVVVFSDYVQPNLALGDGSIDANFFQHQPYLDNFQKSHPLGIVTSTPVFVAPMGAYSAKVRAVADLRDGATLAIPNDPSNASRALLLLERAGLLSLTPGVGTRATVRDVRQNPRGFVLRELDAAQLPHALPDVDLAVLNTNYALQAKLHPVRDALFVEDANSPYANVLATLPATLRKSEFQALSRALTSDAVRRFIAERFEGAIVSVF